MAMKPGILSDWPWKSLGSFKYILLAPWVARSTYSFVFSKAEERDVPNFFILPFLLWRVLHSQLWISLSRHRTAKGSNRIVHKGIEFDQVDRERNWDDQILLSGLLIYAGSSVTNRVPFWNSSGLLLVILLHAGPVEFLYYWLHRALHHHFLYSRYHSHHHSSIVTEPITSVIHPFAEHLAYFFLFATPIVISLYTKTASVISIMGYLTYIDFMNNMGHCNFELIPKNVFTIFPLLKYFMYTPSFHSLHHTHFRTNYCLFMPFYDYIYGTMDKSSDNLYAASLERKEDTPDVVHLMHLTTPDSIYQLRLGFASLASNPYSSKWYMSSLWPITYISTLFTNAYGRTFTVERNRLHKLSLQTWALPKYSIQYSDRKQFDSINNLIEEAVVQAEELGAKVLSFGLLNQGEELNKHGGLFIQRHPRLKLRVVDGSSLAAAVVLHNIPEGTSSVLLRGPLTKVTVAVASSLCRRGVKVGVLHEAECRKLNAILPKFKPNFVLTHTKAHKVWLVGDKLSKEEHESAAKGTVFVPVTPLPLKHVREDCVYCTTPAMRAPVSMENVDSCENWLPRRGMSAWRVAGIVHALEEWKVNECGDTVLSLERAWEASLSHGFTPLERAPNMIHN